MQSFEQFLRNRVQIPFGDESSIVRWVRIYREQVESPAGQQALPDEEAMRRFTKLVGERYSQTQVRQARFALRLCVYYRSAMTRSGRSPRPRAAAPPRAPAPAPPLESTNGPPPDPPETEQARTESASRPATEPLDVTLVRLLRLKHMSYRTEKTYRSWLERFLKFTNCRDIKSPHGGRA